MDTAYNNPNTEEDACIICGHIVREDLEDYTLCSHCTGTICQTCKDTGRRHCKQDNFIERDRLDPRHL